MLTGGGANFEHNFGPGKTTPASVLVLLNLLGFAARAAARPGCLAWAEAMARETNPRVFEHPRTITADVVFHDCEQLPGSITDAAIRPP